uniref:Uncharacterized protein n=1 Tax=Rhizophora mucronata TaxID=61149 RepID=A0A2P2QEH6_RHIMU
MRLCSQFSNNYIVPCSSLHSHEMNKYANTLHCHQMLSVFTINNAEPH